MTFHFLRPWWFIAIIPAVLLLVFGLRKVQSSHNSWAKYCDAHLLPHLLSGEELSLKNYLPYLLFSLWLIAIFALAGPTWSMYGQPVYQKNIARVIALDVSQSMTAKDIAPSRLDRAKYKALDILHAIHEGQTGMLVFSSRAFLVSPLTNDTNTIASMIPVLDNNIVPVQGSDILPALKKAAKLLSQAGNTRGEIILITDSTPSEAAIDEAKKLAVQGYTTSVLGIGTKDGGPITNPDGSMMTDNSGNIVIANFDNSSLNKLASNGNGVYSDFSNDNSDINRLLTQHDLTTQASKELQTKSLWKDEGHYLIWLLIFLAAFIARRGWLDKIC
jgi:Ca-activated chloride channel family protein